MHDVLNEAEGDRAGVVARQVVDIAGGRSLAVGRLVGLGLLSLAGPAGRTEQEGRAVGVELFEGFAGRENARLIEGLWMASSVSSLDRVDEMDT